MSSESVTGLEDPLPRWLITWRQVGAGCCGQTLVPLHRGLCLGPIQCPYVTGDISQGKQSTDHGRKWNAFKGLAWEVTHSHFHLVYRSQEWAGEQASQGVNPAGRLTGANVEVSYPRGSNRILEMGRKTAQGPHCGYS